MSKFMEPDGDVYDPAQAPSHPWEDLFRDIPLKWERVPGGNGWVYRPAGPGVLTHPTTPARLALHVQLCGFQLVEDKRQVQRIDPVRGGRSLTSPGIWQDIKTPIPDANPVNEVLAEAARQEMTPAEMVRAAEALRSAAEAQAQ
ncbi:hypothetical protein SEA_UPYO_19 [Gordonia phage Upyo]|nr:hypothetical protein SEA_UPYO_19 [Gordonia phage Upyo]